MHIDAELYFVHKPVWPHFGFKFELYPYWHKNHKPGKKCVLCCAVLETRFPDRQTLIQTPTPTDITAISNNNKSTHSLKIRQATDTQSAPQNPNVSKRN